MKAKKLHEQALKVFCDEKRAFCHRPKMYSRQNLWFAVSRESGSWQKRYLP
jgi:hypothetical protein